MFHTHKFSEEKKALGVVTEFPVADVAIYEEVVYLPVLCYEG